MPLLGAHMSIAGGLHRAFERIEEVQGEALQVFTKNERQWRAAPLAPEAAALFEQARERWGHFAVAAHDSYLINLAAPDPEKLEKSVHAFADELQRAEMLHIPYLIMHPGSHLGQDVEQALRRLAANLDRAIALAESSRVMVLLETTAGQGTNLGARFEEIAFIRAESRQPDRLGVCFDTCHSFAAGYDIRTPESYRRTFEQFDQSIGLQHLKFFHVNDSKKDLGSRVDRHQHIGEGKIGLPAFALLMNDARFRHHPMVLETPKQQGLEKDRQNLAVLRSLLNENSAAADAASAVATQE